MSIQTATTATVTATNGYIWKNQPFNAGVQDVRATATKTLISNGDSNYYPAIQIDISTQAIQYWVYNLGDEAIRDADLATLNSASSGAGGNIFDQFGSLGNYFQSQSFRGGTILNSSIHIASFQFAIPIYMGGTYTEFSMNSVYVPPI